MGVRGALAPAFTASVYHHAVLLKQRSDPRLYGRRWGKARAAHLEQFPWCVMCEAAGQSVRGSVVDHRKPHRGDVTLFWDETNWQTLCALHHDSTKQRQEKRGQPTGHGSDGTPLDPSHHWNTPSR